MCVIGEDVDQTTGADSDPRRRMRGELKINRRQSVPVFACNQDLCRIHNPHSQSSIVDGLNSARELDDI